MKTFVAIAILVSSARAFSANKGHEHQLETNPCNKLDCVKGQNTECHPADKQAIWAALADLDCKDSTGAVVANVQSGADVTAGERGTLESPLEPIRVPYDQVGMCPVNVHWHLGAEHRSAAQYDSKGSYPEHHDVPHRRKLAEGIESGNMCHLYDPDVASHNTPYHFEYCHGMEVGMTYEIHWPHSNLGDCHGDWQFQSHFMDGVLCKANEGDMTPKAALEAVFSEDRAAKLGVQAQVFTIVNDDKYDYPEWDMLHGWNTDLATDIANYQGSTTGQKSGNTVCRGTGGAVTWQVDRQCHPISARAFDRLCQAMGHEMDDLSGDMHPHNSRATTSAEITSDAIYSGLLDVNEMPVVLDKN